MEGELNNKGLKNGEYTTFYESGAIQSKKHYKNDYLEGKFINYFENGVVSMEGVFKNGKIHGEVKLYNISGQIQSTTKFYDGEMVGHPDKTKSPEFALFPNAIKIMNNSTNYTTIEGNIEYTFDDSRKLIRECELDDNGVKNGEYTTFYESGATQSKGHYKNDYLEGGLTNYFEDGIVSIDGFFKNGKIHGKVKLYDLSGQVQSITEFYEGEMVGLPEKTKSPEFPLFPNEMEEGFDPKIAFKKFIDLPHLGEIYVPEYAITDIQFRLIQLHENLHMYVHPYRNQTFSFMKSYIRNAFISEQLPRGKEGVLAPILITAEEHKKSENLEKKLPLSSDSKIIHTLPDGMLIKITPMSQGAIAVGIIESQLDELFVDFFSSLAAGASYWNTMLDFQFFGKYENSDWIQSFWNIYTPNIFEPHPIPMFRFRFFPMIIFSLFENLFDSTSKKEIFTRMKEQTKDYMQTHLPSFFGVDTLTYINESPTIDELNTLEIDKIEIPMTFMVPYYKIAFEAIAALMRLWCTSDHPLAVFPISFTSSEYHDRISYLFEEFKTGTPKRRYENEFDIFDSVAGSAAARLRFDEDPINLKIYNYRAKDFLLQFREQYSLIYAEPKKDSLIILTK